MDKYNRQLHESLEKEELNATYCNIFLVLFCHKVVSCSHLFCFSYGHYEV